jgi:ribosomal protein L7Ae-like RNA K-turn-binding protein
MDRLLSLLGLARRAGRLKVGHDAVLESIQEGASALVLLSEDLSPRTKRDVMYAAQQCGAETAEIARSKEMIGMALGVKPCGVLSVEDAGFAEKLRLLNTMNGEDTKV